MLNLVQECFRELRTLLDKHTRQLCKGTATTKHMKMIYPGAAYLFRIATTTVDSTCDGNSASFESLLIRIIQISVAQKLVYRSTTGLFEIVLVV